MIHWAIPRCPMPERLCDVLPDGWALELESFADEVHRDAAVLILGDRDTHPVGSIGYEWARKILWNTGLSVVDRRQA